MLNNKYRMEFDKKIEPIVISEQEYFGDEINIREKLEKYAYYWKWFALSLFIAIGVAYVGLRYAQNKYQVSTTILIDNNESGGITNELSAFDDLSVLNKPSSSMANEIGQLKSRSLFEEVVKDLGINITYYHKGKIISPEMYKERVPFQVDFLIKDSILYSLNKSFLITANSKNTFIYEKGIKEEPDYVYKKYDFGENVETDFGQIIITPKNADQINLEETVIVNISSLKNTVNSYINNIIIEEPDDVKSSLLRITLQDRIKHKAIDILDNLVYQYNKEAIAYKSLITNSTNEFINQRISDIYDELNLVDRGVETFKKENRLTNIDIEAESNIASNTRLDNQIAEINAELKLVDYVIEDIQKNNIAIIPMDLGLGDSSLNEIIGEHNNLILNRNRIVQNSSERNPTVVALDNQIRSLRNTISLSLNNLRSTLLISLQQANYQRGNISQKRINAPTMEREFQDIKRRQLIIETLYLYLLQKREENAIALGATSPNAKIIDRANGPDGPFYPNPKITYIIHIAFGLFIPFLIITIMMFLDHKIRTVEDVEKIINAPVLGDIPKTVEKQKIVIGRAQKTSIAEAFRLLRTNINYMFSNQMEGTKTVFITSSIAGEGKTFITLNLATTLAQIEKKVLVIGADIRKPKVMNTYLNLNIITGLSNYLSDNNVQYSQLINHVEETKFDIIVSGDMAPNPSELLVNSRFDDLITYAREHYDYIIIDTPPVSLVTDALLVNKHADLSIFIVKANYLDKRLLHTAKKLYENQRLKNMAILVNNTDYSKKGYGYGSYGYGYGEKVTKKRWWSF